MNCSQSVSIRFFNTNAIHGLIRRFENETNGVGGGGGGQSQRGSGELKKIINADVLVVTKQFLFI